MYNWNDNLKKLFKPGNKVKIFFNEGNINNEIIEIKEIVDNDYIVYRVYNIGEGKYCYKIQFIYYFKLLEKDGCLSLLEGGNNGYL